MTIPTASEIEAIRKRDVVEHHPDRVSQSSVSPSVKIHVFGDYLDLAKDGVRDRHALDAANAENAILRTCFCIADDETVVSSVEGSILIDSKGGTRRRYFVATDEERKLKEQLDAANDKLKRAQSTIRFTLASEVYDFDLVKGCEAICESLHREEDAHSKTRQAMEADKRHIREQIADKHRILGEYQTRLDALTAERDKYRKLAAAFIAMG